ncbi:DUF6973 domain-containing protein [Xenorhabdus miraniensis]|uniref:Colicin-E3 immunity protein n=1 Tax=Xenorhabdus miraniensis TaxID=351674 RepID=A0A2D0JJX9_9GAMM|nr:hypothetical protein [Xenorhabdus miraniensis]PHM46592.1 Colicin-E3 immunity protein [Xenorhabdus miraniensis]
MDYKFEKKRKREEDMKRFEEITELGYPEILIAIDEEIKYNEKNIRDITVYLENNKNTLIEDVIDSELLEIEYNRDCIEFNKIAKELKYCLQIKKATPEDRKICAEILDEYNKWYDVKIKKFVETLFLEKIISEKQGKKSDLYSKFPTEEEIRFVLSHPITAKAIGEFKRGEKNITTNAIRFSTQGKGDYILAPKFRAIFEARGSEVNAFRHAVWISTIAAQYGEEIAQHIGNAHEGLWGKMPEKFYKKIDLNKRIFDDMEQADSAVDILNNQIARELGAKAGSKSMKQLSLGALDYFYHHGLYVFTNYELDLENSDENDVAYSIEIGKRKITDKQYNYMRNLFNQLDDNGMLPSGFELDSTGKITPIK